MVKALVFDMDGLLIDSERVVQRAWNGAGDKLGYPNIGVNICHTLGMNRTARNEFFLKNFGKDFPLDDFNREEHNCFFEIVQREGIPVKPGARELLDYAKERGLATALCTSSSRPYATRVLTDAGLFDYFVGGAFGDMITHGKPHPEIYLKACESIQMRPEECIAFEDAPLGVRSAHAAGIPVFVVPDLLEPTEEILKLTAGRLDTLHEAIAYLEAI